jgi:hypothetical protein
MKELIQFTFDFFAHVLPGSIVVFSLALLYPETQNMENFVALTKSFDAVMGTMVIVTAYIIGFAVNPFGKYLCSKLGFNLWKMNVENQVKMFISDKYILIRQYSPANFKYVEIWNTYCAMSHNLAVAFLLLLVVCIVKITAFNAPVATWFPLALAALFLFFVLLYRSVIFSLWAARDLNAAITCLDLGKKEPGKG